MIERFNFYDVYGYLVPGFALLLVFSIPYFAAGGTFPFDDLADAVVVIIAAYIAGHLLQIVAGKVMPIRTKAAGQTTPRTSSDLMLDPGRLAPATRARLQTKILSKFGIDIDAAGPGGRDEAFLQARNILSASDRRSYAEQFQGMYSMMRGLSCAAAAGFLFDAGWLIGARVAIADRYWVAAGVVVTIILAVFRDRIPEQGSRRLAFTGSLALLIVVSGALFVPPRPKGLFEVSAAAASSLLCSLWTHGAYRKFSDSWAKTVYLDFLEVP